MALRYTYDAVDRLKTMARGTLDTNGQIQTGTQTYSQDFTLDGQGNFSEFDDDGVIQQRQVNAANEGSETGTQRLCLDPLQPWDHHVVRDGPQEQFEHSGLAAPRPQCIPKVPLDHRVDRLGLRTLAIAFALL